MIELTSGTLRIGERTIFEKVSLNVEPHSLVALTGPSGSGKTSLLNCLGLIRPLTAGSLAFDGRDTATWTSRERRLLWRDEAAFIYQDHGMIPDETVAFNVSLQRHSRLNRRRRNDDAVVAALGTVGLADRADDPVTQLSGGERQRVGIARALHKGARYLFADEPTASLDHANAERVIDLLVHARVCGVAVIVATHDPRFGEVSDHICDLS